MINYTIRFEATMATDCARKDVREWGFGIDTGSGG